ncbi:response regulator transcription factor [Treponema brennaborense]|uniref:Two component transcriptional regulator, LuxR family n=1 Tax=Treponema brennaborense (strain DSM 12168 / CIP 105900 / DD5/3) TaxID=906968 RepID=F4LL99_TREBD|nr:response regulator transcription factor [Treponema brennaborense]AEE15577.1 two component transcriptional regulator, LuxR family [Treponema brennaborense DSM 12168]
MTTERQETSKILLADDQIIFIESLSTYLTNYADDIEIVGTAHNGIEAVALARQFLPHIIVMDVSMPEMDGIEAVRQIKNLLPETKIIMLSTYQEDELVRSALLAGASGYLLKDISPTELITAIRALKSGIMQISPGIIKKLVKERFTPASRPDPDDAPWLKELTNREREIATLLVTGYSNEQIAEKLHLAIQTVRNQVSAIYFKTGVKDRFEMIRLANRNDPCTI